jgi:hypothetical protein
MPQDLHLLAQLVVKLLLCGVPILIRSNVGFSSQLNCAPCPLGLSRVSNVCTNCGHIHDVGSVLVKSVSPQGPISRYPRLIFVFCTAPQRQVAMSVISPWASGTQCSGAMHPLKSTVIQLFTLWLWVARLAILDPSLVLVAASMAGFGSAVQVVHLLPQFLISEGSLGGLSLGLLLGV